MKAIILAAGQGTRLRPVTLTMPKPLVPVANKRLIEYSIDIIRDAGIDDIGIVVNSMDSPIVDTYGDGAGLGANIEYIVQEEQLGLAHAIKQGQEFVGDEPFTVFLSDNIFQDKMTGLLSDFPDTDADAALVLTPVPDPSRFGIAVVENGEIQRVVEKPDDPPSDMAIVGVYLFRSSIFDAIDKIEPSDRGEYEITDAIQELIEADKRINSYEIEGWYIDAGKPEPIVLANQLVLEDLPYTPKPSPDDERVQGDSDVSHRVVMGENVQIIDSVVRGPVVIGDNTVIRDSYVGPYTAIGEDCTIFGCEVESSIIMNKCELSLVPGRIDRSFIAHESKVMAADRMPATYRFVLAEESIVEV
jgi:glucose-1-phosphate thymidylyltransferase